MSNHIWRTLPNRIAIQLMTLAIVVVLDVLGPRRDWLHWLGIGVVTILLLNILCFNLYHMPGWVPDLLRSFY